MAHWTLAVLLTISVLLGLSQAYSSCDADGNSLCVKSENCKPGTYNSFESGCVPGAVCCTYENINIPCGVQKQDKCVIKGRCTLPFNYRSGEDCPQDFECCQITKKIPLTIKGERL
ncbi:uncharacterized protein LOC108106643 [Drosophila eugracilis]|uniref:uncharacterized protein LOC108106643 n=1 Tax=Drosophila eugracilis TaxID=29029 RepID=UPI0007E5E63F|nr:uncharacterized protein LOC108106643 [Drosophila eugracilis]